MALTYRDPRWRRLRAAHLRGNPACVLCGARGQHVDHKRPHRGNEALFLDPTNLQTLCQSCHGHKTARRDGAFGNNPSAVPLKGTRVDGAPADPEHHWHR
jgi:5-methylcytosine-specific restriction enzyme A